MVGVGGGGEGGGWEIANLYRHITVGKDIAIIPFDCL